MALATVRLFPGQGSFRPSALREYHEEPAIQNLISQVDAVGRDFDYPPIGPLLIDAPASGQNAPPTDDSTQLAIFAQAVGINRLLGAPARGDVLVGHSIGEIAALTAAGAFDITTGARIVCLRNAALRAETPVAGGLVAVSLPADRAAHLVGALGDRSATIACENAPSQTVISAAEPALDTIAAAARALGAEAVRLAAPYPFHNPLLRAAAKQFAAEIATARQLPLQAAVFSPIEERYYTDSDDLGALLASHLYRPNRFVDAVRELHAHGFSSYVECSVAQTLGKLVAATVPDVAVSAFQANANQQAPQWIQPPVTVVPQQRPAQPAPPVTPPPPAPPAAPPPTSTTPSATPLDRESVLSDLRQFYASALDYPESVVEANADLEADLGVDSMQQTELLARVTAKYSLPQPGNDLAVSNYATLADVANFVIERRQPTNGAASAPADARASDVR